MKRLLLFFVFISLPCLIYAQCKVNYKEVDFMGGSAHRFTHQTEYIYTPNSGEPNLAFSYSVFHNGPLEGYRKNSNKGQFYFEFHKNSRIKINFDVTSYLIFLEGESRGLEFHVESDSHFNYEGGVAGYTTISNVNDLYAYKVFEKEITRIEILHYPKQRSSNSENELPPPPPNKEILFDFNNINGSIILNQIKCVQEEITKNR